MDLLNGDEPLKVVLGYAVNLSADRNVFLKKLWQFVDTPGRTILAGDFSCVLTSKDTSATPQEDSSHVELKKVIARLQFARCD